MENTKTSKDKYQDIVDEYLSGVSGNKIAEEYGVCSYTIYSILRKMDIKRDVHRKVVNHHITKEEIPVVIELYKNGKYVRDISKEYHISELSIKKVLQENNIAIRRFAKESQFSEDEIYHMHELYDEGKTLDELGAIYNINPTTVGYLFKQRNYKIRDYSHASRKYNLNENYFDAIDTQNKAYILGLLWADGCHNSSRNVIQISLQDRDKHILESIRKEIDLEQPLRFINYHDKKETWHDQYCLSIHNEHMSKVLEDYGMVDNKSLVLEFPKCIPENLYSHFIRGYFDGDGHVSGPDKKYYKASIVSTENFCFEVQNILNSNGIKSKIYNTYNKETTTRELSINNKLYIKKFLDYIYQDAELYLFRKYDIYLKKYNNLFDSEQPIVKVANS